MHKVAQNCIYIYNLYTVLLAWISSNIWSYSMYIYGSGQPYIMQVLGEETQGEAATTVNVGQPEKYLRNALVNCFPLFFNHAGSG